MLYSIVKGGWALKIGIDVKRDKVVSRPQAELSGIFSDVEASLKKFPKLKKLSRIDDHSFKLDVQTIGSSVARIAHDLSFGARFTVMPELFALSFAPMPGVGNAGLSGELSVESVGNASRLTMRVHGELYEVPVPLIYRLVAPPFIQGKFAALIDGYLEKLSEG